jgi:hypothetical protein
MGVIRNAYTLLVGTPRRNKPSGMSQLRCKDNIKLDLRDRMGRMGWRYLAQEREEWKSIMNMVMKFRIS